MLSISTADGREVQSASVELTLHRAGLDDLTWVTTLDVPFTGSFDTLVSLPSMGSHGTRGQVPTRLLGMVLLEVDGVRHRVRAQPAVLGEDPAPQLRDIGGFTVMDVRSAHTLGAVRSVDGDVGVEDDSE